ncbi:hypothetical protein OUZ56_012160 [Daphnia magna]|uniref:Uncharacterized protein n=1 Tax=Daphnia magna TaxID=35525 RepID=A0ABQ9Z272_9CRUS|nr:hypothetical protein OUZ56_012160 [Daphnia magna]
MEETYGRNWKQVPEEKYLSSLNCTEEYANENKLQQDHPCVIRLIRRKYLLQPAPKTLPYRLTIPESKNPSDGQSQAILRILQNKVSATGSLLKWN